MPILLGLSVIGYSLLTRYQLGVAQVIPFKVHVGFDAAGGLLLLVSPLLFGFADLIRSPHVVVGLAELAVVGMTARKAPAHRQA